MKLGLPLIILLLAIAYLTIVYGLLKMVEKPRHEAIAPKQTTRESDRGMETS